jgi:transcriptional regulator with XRE-family HTH domain
MAHDFGNVLRGLMQNRGLSPSSLSQAAGRAEATIRRLLNGDLPPRADHLQDIAPVLHIPLPDMFAIAAIPMDEPLSARRYDETQERIGELIMLANALPPAQIDYLVGVAEELNSRYN